MNWYLYPENKLQNKMRAEMFAEMQGDPESALNLYIQGLVERGIDMTRSANLYGALHNIMVFRYQMRKHKERKLAKTKI